jgi:hypothetical protein
MGATRALVTVKKGGLLVYFNTIESVGSLLDRLFLSVGVELEDAVDDDIVARADLVTTALAAHRSCNILAGAAKHNLGLATQAAAHQLTPKEVSALRSIRRKANSAKHVWDAPQLPGESSSLAGMASGATAPAKDIVAGDTCTSTGQTSELALLDGKASGATGCSKNLALDVEAPGISDPVPVKIQVLPLDKIPDLGLGASHSGNPIVDVGAPGFVDPAQVKSQGRLPDMIPDSDHGASRPATLDHVQATSQAVPPLTLDLVVKDTVDDFVANSNMYRKPPDKIKYSAPLGDQAGIKRELAAIDRAIKNNTQAGERIDQELRQPRGLGTEQIASLQRKRASCWKANETLRATRAKVFEQGTQAALQ